MMRPTLLKVLSFVLEVFLANTTRPGRGESNGRYSDEYDIDVGVSNNV